MSIQHESTRGTQQQNENKDDYFSNPVYSLDDFSLTYGTCQKVQRYSPNAVQSGEYNSIVTDDIVILRLCPKTSCTVSSSSTTSQQQHQDTRSSSMGCSSYSSSHGDYILPLSDYVKIVLQYQYDRQSKYCNYCSYCSSVTAAIASSSNNKSYKTNNNKRTLFNWKLWTWWSSKSNDDDDFNTDNSANFIYNCYNYESVCSGNICGTDGKNDDNSNKDASSTYYDYISYIGCVKQKNYYINPYCNAHNHTISMGVFYDPYCSHLVDRNVTDVYALTGIPLNESILTSFLQIECLDCSLTKTKYLPPYFESNNYLCNNVYKKSGRCDSSIRSKLGYLGRQSYYDDYDPSSSVASTSFLNRSDVECSFINSLLTGTYDMFGQFSSVSSHSNTGQGSKEGVVTLNQILAISAFSVAIIALSIYSCVLHHKLTNFLLKSLSVGLVDSRKRSFSLKRNTRNGDVTEDEHTKTEGPAPVKGGDIRENINQTRRRRSLSRIRSEGRSRSSHRVNNKRSLSRKNVRLDWDDDYVANKLGTHA